MRIVSGKFRGKKIAWISGEKTRPTKDNVRESIFNILAHGSWSAGIDERKVLDVFAGTGAMGLEAYSRGAQDVVFIENDMEAFKICQQNIDDLKLGNAAKLLKKDVTKLGPRPTAITKRDLIFLDPPYGKGLGEASIKELLENNWIAENATFVLEMAEDRPESLPESLIQEDERRYGISKIVFLTLNN